MRISRLFPALLLLLLLTLFPARAAHADTELTSTLNAVRALGCGGNPGAPAALRENPALDEAMKRTAGGLPYTDALKAVQYRATRSSFMRLSGTVGARATADVLTANYCANLVDAGFDEIGVYQQGRDTWVVLTAAFAPPAGASAADAPQRVLELVNVARAQARVCGDKPFAAAGTLKLNSQLSAIALAHASDMAQNSYFAHQGRDGSQPADRVTRGGYRWRAVGENIAAGQTTPEAAVEGWIKSPPHCANLMSPQFTEMGLAFAVNRTSDGGIYWVQLFGTPR